MPSVECYCVVDAQGVLLRRSPVAAAPALDLNRLAAECMGITETARRAVRDLGPKVRAVLDAHVLAAGLLVACARPRSHACAATVSALPTTVSFSPLVVGSRCTALARRRPRGHHCARPRWSFSRYCRAEVAIAGKRDRGGQRSSSSYGNHCAHATLSHPGTMWSPQIQHGTAASGVRILTKGGGGQGTSSYTEKRRMGAREHARPCEHGWRSSGSRVSSARACGGACGASSLWRPARARALAPAAARPRAF